MPKNRNEEEGIIWPKKEEDPLEEQIYKTQERLRPGEKLNQLSTSRLYTILQGRDNQNRKTDHAHTGAHTEFHIT